MIFMCIDHTRFTQAAGLPPRLAAAAGIAFFTNLAAWRALARSALGQRR
jgi:hypothetical protein